MRRGNSDAAVFRSAWRGARQRQRVIASFDECTGKKLWWSARGRTQTWNAQPVQHRESVGLRPAACCERWLDTVSNLSIWLPAYGVERQPRLETVLLIWPRDRALRSTPLSPVT